MSFIISCDNSRSIVARAGRETKAPDLCAPLPAARRGLAAKAIDDSRIEEADPATPS